MTHTQLLGIAALLGLLGCQDDGGQGREKVQRTGKAVGRTAGDFVSGISSGVRAVSHDRVELAPALTSAGLRTGRFAVKSDDDKKTRRVLNVYLIFDQNFKQRLTVKAIDRDGNEYGRIVRQLRGNAGEARYEEFAFESPERVVGRSRFIFE